MESNTNNEINLNTDNNQQIQRKTSIDINLNYNEYFESITDERIIEWEVT